MSDQKSRPPRSNSKRKFSFKKLFLCFLLLIAAFIVASCFIPVTNWLYATGYVMTNDESEIRTPVEGAIKAYYAKDGDIVKKGQPVIQLECDVESAALENAKNELDTMKAKLKSLKISYDLNTSTKKQKLYRAQRNLEQAKKEFVTVSADKVGAVSRRERDEVKLRVDMAQSELEELQLPTDELLKKQIEITEEQLEAVRAKVLVHEAQLRLKTITATQDGVVYFNRFDIGEVVTPADALGQVFDTSQWVVRLKLNERDLKYISMEQNVEVELAGYNSMLHGYVNAKVSKIVPVVSPQTTGDGIFLIKARIGDSKDPRLHPGMSATARINAGKITLIRRIIGV